MEKIIERGTFTYEINTEVLKNGVSSVACVKSFVKPEKTAKANRKVVDTMDERVKSVAYAFIEASDLFSYNSIVDFECTRENLNPEKWSRMKVDLFLFTPFVECEDEAVCETVAVCDAVSGEIKKLAEENRFELTRTVEP